MSQDFQGSGVGMCGNHWLDRLVRDVSVFSGHWLCWMERWGSLGGVCLCQGLHWASVCLPVSLWGLMVLLRDVPLW